jgi:NADH:ubiquinone oxidoreductase subunit 3 (subunit A)
MTFLLALSLKFLSLFIYTLFLTVTIILVSFSFSVSQPDSQKLSAYECGFEPYEDSRNKFDVRFYLVAIFFIIFDLEAIFFFPYSASLFSLNQNSLFLIWDFLLELVIGFIYAWKVGALNWSDN